MLVYLKSRVTESDRCRQSKRVSMCSFTPQTATTAKAGLLQANSQERLPSLPCECVRLCSFPRAKIQPGAGLEVEKPGL